MVFTPRLCTHQPEPQSGDLVSLPGSFHVLHQPADLSDALLVALGWLDAAGCFGVHDAASVAQPSSDTATAKGYR